MREAGAPLIPRVVLFGNPGKTSPSVSPDLFKAGAIRAAVMIVQRANDTRSAKAESDSIVAALRAKGTAVEYLVFADEGSTVASPVNRLAFYEAAERFLGKNLGGRFEGARKK